MAHQLTELSELSQPEVFTIPMGHPVLFLYSTVLLRQQIKALSFCPLSRKKCCNSMTLSCNFQLKQNIRKGPPMKCEEFPENVLQKRFLCIKDTFETEEQNSWNSLHIPRPSASV